MPQPEKVHVFGNKLLSMLCPTCSICWTHILCRFLLVPCWGLDLLQFYAILSFYFLYSSATENQLHMSRGMVPCQVLRVPHCCFWCIVGPGSSYQASTFQANLFPKVPQSQSDFSVPM
jgi:hypothetical protein